MAVSKRLRYEILRRDNFTCQYCGAKAPDVNLVVDHVAPKALVKDDSASNLVAACPDCNKGKTSMAPDAPLVAAVNEKAAQYAVALNRVIEQRQAKQTDDTQLVRWFDKMWCGWTSTPMDRDGNWESSVLRFRAIGLTPEFIERAVNSAMGNRRISGRNVWSYFCGICWNEVKDIQAEAAALCNTPPSVPLERQYPAPWVDFADYLTIDLFNLITGVEDCGEFETLLSNQVWAGMQVMFEAFYAAIQDGDGDRDSAEDQAKDRLGESDRYTRGIEATRASFDAAMARQAGSDGA